MAKPANGLIAEIKRNKRFIGTCPSCNEPFRLADAILFSVTDTPPPEAMSAIEGKKQALKDRQEEYRKRRERITTGAERTAAAVNLGKIVEKIVPSFSTFSYRPGDCRALFEPIDYLVFPGLTSAGRVDALVFIDVKSGKARLTNREKEIKTIVDTGSVRLESH